MFAAQVSVSIGTQQIAMNRESLEITRQGPLDPHMVHALPVSINNKYSLPYLNVLKLSKNLLRLTIACILKMELKR
jgi:hypothetical protein